MTPYHLMHRALRASLTALLLTTLCTATALAQGPPPTPGGTPGAQNAPQSLRIRARVSMEGVKDGDQLEGIPVFLRAARVKGPFEPNDPEPAREWSALTNASGEVVFEDVPASIIDQGLRLQAVASYDDNLYKSPQVVPTQGLRIDLPIYERGFDLSTLRVDSVRMIIEPWEDYLVYTQMWTLNVEGKQALDVSLIPSPDYENGIPFELPLKAQGINFQGTEGQHKVVNSTVYWKGVVKPGQPVSFQLRYSMPAKESAIVYEQPLDYPTKKLEIIVPLETPYKNKLPRLNNLGIRAPDFKQEDIRSGFDIPGLRPDKEFLYAVRNDLPDQSSIRFQLYNLPYERSRGPWIALAIGLLGVLLVAAFARKEMRVMKTQSRAEELRAALLEERRELFVELEELEADRAKYLISERDFEIESTQITSRIGLILKKLEELEGARGDTAS